MGSQREGRSSSPGKQSGGPQSTGEKSGASPVLCEEPLFRPLISVSGLWETTPTYCAQWDVQLGPHTAHKSLSV